MGITKKEEKNYAQILFVSENLTAKEIAARVGVSEKTVGKWIKDGNWEKLRKSLLITKQQQISMLYDQLAFINNDIANREVKVATSKEADVISKITSSIQRMEIETSIGQIVEVAKNFIEFVREYDLAFAKDATKHFDSFIQTKMR
jgi:transposase